MKNRILALILALLIVFSLASCSGNDGTTQSKSAFSGTSSQSSNNNSSEVSAENISTPMFWKVTGNGYDGQFYLLGSIHVGDQYTNAYPKEITDAFERCKYLAVESDIIEVESSLALQTKMLKEIMYSDGTTIQDHIDSELYNDAKELLTENGMYNQAYDMLLPVYWMMLTDNISLSETDLKEDNGVDRFFLTSAKESDKSILEIEDPIETYRALASLKDKTQEILLKLSIETDFKQAAEDLNELYSVWKKGDMDEFEESFTETSTEGMSQDEIAANQEYSDMLITVRNEAMVETAVSYLESGKSVFYIVGLAHMVGEGGIVQELIQKGYTVELVEYSINK